MENNIYSISIGSVYYMKFDGIGSEQKGWRPGVVFQNNSANLNSPNVIALPCTTVMKKIHQPTHVLLRRQESGMAKDSIVLCENPQRMSKVKIGEFITQLPDKYIRQIATASMLASSVISFITYDDLIATWRKAKALNKVNSGGSNVFQRGNKAEIYQRRI